MGVKYLRDFEFPSAGGFHGSNKMPSNVGKATGAPRMASMPKVGKGQGYAEGGRVPGYDMDRLPAKKPPGRGMDLAPSKPFKGKYEGYADGGLSTVKAALARGKAASERGKAELAKTAALRQKMGVKPRGSGVKLPSENLVPGRGKPAMISPAAKRVEYIANETGQYDPSRGSGAGAVMMPSVEGQMQQVSTSPLKPYAKGGKAKGKKIAKVMREYKEGKLHSGSKKGPVVKNPKQAMAIALSEAGAKKKAEGGLTSYEESGSAGGSNVSFKEAFRKAREQGLKEFSWKGDKYSTKVKEETKQEAKVEEKAPKAEMGRKGPESRGGKRNVTEMSEYKRERKMELPSDRSTSFRSEAEETGMSASERAEKARGYAENLMNVAGAGALLRAPAKAAAKSLMRKGMEFVGGRKMKKEAAETAARKSTPEYKEKAAQMEKFAEQMRARQKMGARYEDGGYASKGPKTRYTAAKGRRQSKERAMERWAEQRMRHAEAYAPGVDPDMKSKGGMPVHRRKPMYGGGKC